MTWAVSQKQMQQNGSPYWKGRATREQLRARISPWLRLRHGHPCPFCGSASQWSTIVGSFAPDVVSAPGYRLTESRQNAEGGVRVAVAEGGVLQSFPADYPWVGVGGRNSKTKQYECVGNAIPPILAAAVLSAALGSAWDEATFLACVAQRDATGEVAA